MFQHQEEHVDPEMILIQANVDDMIPEHCPYVLDKLFAAGVNDAYWVPIIMKKGRPGLMLNVFVHQGKLDEMVTLIFKETTTLGVRYTPMSCHRLGREIVKVDTKWGQVPVKVGVHKGENVQHAPEFSACEQIAREHDVPLKEVYEEVRACYVNSREEGM